MFFFNHCCCDQNRVTCRPAKPECCTERPHCDLDNHGKCNHCCRCCRQEPRRCTCRENDNKQCSCMQKCHCDKHRECPCMRYGGSNNSFDR